MDTDLGVTSRALDVVAHVLQRYPKTASQVTTEILETIVAIYSAHVDSRVLPYKVGARISALPSPCLGWRASYTNPLISR